MKSKNLVYLIFLLLIIELTSCDKRKNDLAQSNSNLNLDSASVVKVLTIQWKDLGYIGKDTTEVGNIVPGDFAYDGGEFVIPNRIAHDLLVFDEIGSLVRKNHYENVDDILKFAFSNSADTVYILDSSGVSIFAMESLIFHDDQISDFYQGENGEVLFEREYNNEILLYDREVRSKGPLKRRFYSVYVSRGELFGIEILGETFYDPIVFERIDLSNYSTIYKIAVDSICPGCLMAPKLVAPNLIVATNDRIKKDQVFSIHKSGKLELLRTIDLPIDFVMLRAPFGKGGTYSGVLYKYNMELGKMFIVACDVRGVNLFSLQLKSL